MDSSGNRPLPDPLSSGDAEPEDAESDLDLVRRLNRGDADAFDAIYERYRVWVYRLAHRLTRHDPDALDVLQETFAYVVRKFPGFELRARFTTFLYPVVRHLSLTAIEKRRRWNPGRAEPNSAGAAEEPELPLAADERQVLRRAIDRLPEKQREVLLLRFLDGQDVAMVAETLEIPAGTVKSRVHHALAQLRRDPDLRRLFSEDIFGEEL